MLKALNTAALSKCCLQCFDGEALLQVCGICRTSASSSAAHSSTQHTRRQQCTRVPVRAQLGGLHSAFPASRFAFHQAATTDTRAHHMTVGSMTHQIRMSVGFILKQFTCTRDARSTFSSLTASPLHSPLADLSRRQLIKACNGGARAEPRSPVDADGAVATFRSRLKESWIVLRAFLEWNPMHASVLKQTS